MATSKRKQMLGVENQEAAGETTTVKANALSHTKFARRIAIDKDAGE